LDDFSLKSRGVAAGWQEIAGNMPASLSKPLDIQY
jgi:hypothetical protein